MMKNEGGLGGFAGSVCPDHELEGPQQKIQAVGKLPKRNCHPSLPWGPWRQGRHKTAALMAVWGENRALMSILIGSDS